MQKRKFTNKEVYQRAVIAAIVMFIVFTILIDIIIGIIAAVGIGLVGVFFGKKVMVEK